MPAEISFGVVCRDVDLLPNNEPELRAFYDNFLVPAIYEDFRQNFLMVTGQGFSKTRPFSAEIAQRQCTVTGGVTIRI